MKRLVRYAKRPLRTLRCPGWFKIGGGDFVPLARLFSNWKTLWITRQSLCLPRWRSVLWSGCAQSPSDIVPVHDLAAANKAINLPIPDVVCLGSAHAVTLVGDRHCLEDLETLARVHQRSKYFRHTLEDGDVITLGSEVPTTLSFIRRDVRADPRSSRSC